MIDILLPKGNEKELIDMAKRLGYKRIILAYDSAAKRGDLTDTKGIEVFQALLCKKNENVKPQMISLSKGKDGFREFLERGGKIAFDLEIDEKADQNYFRNSGLNQVVCKLAKDNYSIIGYSAKTLIYSGQRQSVLWGRMAQNIRFCKKFKVNNLFFSFASEPYEMRSGGELDALSRTLGMGQFELNKAKIALNEMIEKIYVRKEWNLPEGMKTVPNKGEGL